MPDSFGLSFAPLNQNAQMQGRGTSGTPGVGGTGPSPVQDAIQILNLKIPRVVGGSPVAPPSLLNGPGGSGLGGRGDIDALLRQLFGQSQQPMGQPGPGNGVGMGNLFSTFYGGGGNLSAPMGSPLPGPSRAPSPNIGVFLPTTPPPIVPSGPASPGPYQDFNRDLPKAGPIG